jgi:hypothetical protein
VLDDSAQISAVNVPLLNPGMKPPGISAFINSAMIASINAVLELVQSKDRKRITRYHLRMGDDSWSA